MGRGLGIHARPGLIVYLGAQRPRFGQVLGIRLARHVGGEVGEGAGPIAGRAARYRAREAGLLDVERHGPVDQRPDQRLDVVGAGRLLARLPELAHAGGERPQGGAVVLQRFERRGRKLSRQRIRADRGRDEAGRVGQRLIEQLASQPDGIADANPFLGLLVEAARHVRREGRAPAALLGGAGGAPAPELVAQLLQIGPARFQRERVAQGLVGPLRLQRAAVLRQDLAQHPPAERIGRGEVHGDLEIARRLVHAARGFEGARTQHQRPCPGRVAPDQRIGGSERVVRAPAVERMRRRVGLGGVVARDLGPWPVLERVRAIVERDRFEQIQHALALRAGQRRFGVDGEQRFEPRARRRAAPDRPLEVGDAEHQVEPPLLVLLDRVETLLEKCDDRVAAFPARRIVGVDLGEVHPRVNALGILVDRAAQQRFGLGAAAEAPEREAVVRRVAGVPGIVRDRGGEQLGRLLDAARPELRHRLGVLRARGGACPRRRCSGAGVGRRASVGAGAPAVRRTRIGRPHQQQPEGDDE